MWGWKLGVSTFEGFGHGVVLVSIMRTGMESTMGPVTYIHADQMSVIVSEILKWHQFPGVTKLVPCLFKLVISIQGHLWSCQGFFSIWSSFKFLSSHLSPRYFDSIH